MKNLRAIGAIFFAIALVGCVTIVEDGDNNGGSGGGGNGGSGATGQSSVSANTQAGGFTATEKQTFCEWFVELGEPKVGEEFDCGDDITITIEPYTVTQCEQQLAQNPGCPVSDLEGCFEVLIEDPCLLVAETAPPACAALDQCAQTEVVDDNNDTGNNGVGGNNGAGGNNSTTELCYDHDCNGDATGEQCFSNQEDYCASLCMETNCISVTACENECL